MMDSSEKDEAVLDKRNGDQSSYHAPTIPSEWRFSGDLPIPSFNLVPTDVCRGVPFESSSSSSVSVVDSFCPSIWDSHNPISQHLGFKQADSHSNGESNISSVREMISASRVGWNGSASLSISGNPFEGIVPQSLVQFPADSGFIERAARFSCFSCMMNPFPLSESMPSFSKVGGMTPIAQNNDMGISETCKDGLVAPDEGDPTKKVCQKMVNLLKSTGSTSEGKQRVGSSSIESDGAEICGSGKEEPSHLDSAVKEPSPKGHSSKKRKRTPQGTEQNQANSSSQLAMDTGDEYRENKPEVEANQIIVAGKPNGKQPKDNSQVLDTQKEDYIHVRARRGQATNSHSLAERVRREKISERMKFLQDLVPGCSKVTGKAVMLDEIINYVQSLQRQVEFLSMKLATVNPQFDLSMDSLLLKDTFHSRGVLSSAVGYAPDVNMIQSNLQPSHQGLVQTGIPGIPTPSDSLRRAFNSYLTSTGGYKESSQIPNAWEDELNNVVQMSFGTGMPFNNNQEQSGN